MCAWLESKNDYLAGILQEDYGLQDGDELSDVTVQAEKGSAMLY
ncbi:MAG: hypothetical protein ACR5LF_11915 [Symbiopectobacterium sp.]